ncbi:nucleotidyl transferase AbiEii/AbiGii toxin family protein [Tunturiibacter gelidiferens]|uniref:nucleotidyl transferase AbiEii/AbiGii toxin family protein n=1 Tax=Tunturiibacter gelidiferens TaxID=3069689 RepID=UPI003D9AC170
MSVFSNQLFISPEHPVDPFTVSILELIDRLLRDATIRYMLVGATARDLLLYHVFGHAVTRATYDLDFAIFVDSWEQFAIVKQLFLNIPGFTDKGRNAQRLYYQLTGASFETIIDIIPVASLPGLIVLKFFAWLDRHEGRDVQDIRRLIETYTDAGNVDRLYEEEADELERVGFDTVLAGAFLLGKDAQRITDENVRTRLSTSLSGKELPALVLEFARTMSALDDHTESAEALLSGFFRGMGLADLL